MAVGEAVVGTRHDVDGRNGESARPLRRRRPLPGGRAVVGGFLVSLAGVGVFAGYTSATSDTRIDYLVARSDLTIGQRITRTDLGHLPMDLPEVVKNRSFRDAGKLVGAVALGPVGRGDLIQTSDVLLGRGTPPGREVSFAVESARAVDGQLQRGELVDVLATYGTGEEAYTVTVARAVRVVSRRQPRGTLSDGREEVITVSVPTSEKALAVTHAVNAGAVTLVRTVGGADDNDTDPHSYQAPGPDAPAGAAPAE